jgi:hypothetical protein
MKLFDIRMPEQIIEKYSNEKDGELAWKPEDSEKFRNPGFMDVRPETRGELMEMIHFELGKENPSQENQRGSSQIGDPVE